MTNRGKSLALDVLLSVAVIIGTWLLAVGLMFVARTVADGPRLQYVAMAFAALVGSLAARRFGVRTALTILVGALAVMIAETTVLFTTGSAPRGFGAHIAVLLSAYVAIALFSLLKSRSASPA